MEDLAPKFHHVDESFYRSLVKSFDMRGACRLIRSQPFDSRQSQAHSRPLFS